PLAGLTPARLDIRSAWTSAQPGHPLSPAGPAIPDPAPGCRSGPVQGLLGRAHLTIQVGGVGGPDIVTGMPGEQRERPEHLAVGAVHDHPVGMPAPQALDYLPVPLDRLLAV